MTQSRYSHSEIQQRLNEPGICFRLGPFVVEVSSDIATIGEGLGRFYAEYPRVGEDGYSDFHVRLSKASGLRRWYRPQVLFSMDGRHPFKPMPFDQAFPMFEWTLNWCVANFAHQYLIFHSAVVERDGVAVVLAAPSGSGKSTLCAALVNRGWRLFSDELALINLSDGQVVPFPRPVGLKNDSIRIIREYAPNAVFGPATHDTHKGTVAHMKAPRDSIDRAAECARPGWVIFPRYVEGADVSLSPLKKTTACLGLIKNSFNYHVLGQAGFEAVTDLVDHSHCSEFAYSRLDDAVAAFDKLELTPP